MKYSSVCVPLSLRNQIRCPIAAIRAKDGSADDSSGELYKMTLTNEVRHDQ